MLNMFANDPHMVFDDDGNIKIPYHYDMRSRNGSDHKKGNGEPRKQIGKFTIFWQFLEQFLKQYELEVDQRRHGNNWHLPIAISVPDLIEQVKTLIRNSPHTHGEVPIPSPEWVGLQFLPADPYTLQAARYKGRFSIVMKMQSRFTFTSNKGHTIIIYHTWRGGE
jgi:hypothetical protein